MDLFDYKPALDKLSGTELPASIRQGQRITGMTSGQSSLPVARSIFSFKQYGQSGAWVSELLPHTAKIVDDIALIKTMNTDAINHDPAITFIQSGSQQPGRPSMGAWVGYGLGSENRNLPAFVVMLSQAQALNPDQPLFSRLWGSGFLPSNHQGVRFRAGSNPVLYLHNPEGIDPGTRREMLDAAGKLNRMHFDLFGDPEIESRIAQYEMAFRMQTSVPDLLDLSKEPQHIFDLYGPDARKPGTYAANCLLARRLLERDVRFVQLYHRGWDQHNDLPRDLALQCKGTDQATAALVMDLKQRGLLDDTLVVWGGEFGRTVILPGPPDRDELRPRPPSPLFHDVDGRRRRQARLQLRRNRRLLLQRRQGPGPRPRSAGHDSALPGRRPHQADLQVPGPPLPPDGRARRGSEGGSGVFVGVCGFFRFFLGLFRFFLLVFGGGVVRRIEDERRKNNPPPPYFFIILWEPTVRSWRHPNPFKRGKPPSPLTKAKRSWGNVEYGVRGTGSSSQ